MDRRDFLKAILGTPAAAVLAKVGIRPEPEQLLFKHESKFVNAAPKDAVFFPIETVPGSAVDMSELLVGPFWNPGHRAMIDYNPYDPPTT